VAIRQSTSRPVPSEPGGAEAQQRHPDSTTPEPSDVLQPDSKVSVGREHCREEYRRQQQVCREGWPTQDGELTPDRWSAKPRPVWKS
jgi:hypothetical protein